MEREGRKERGGDGEVDRLAIGMDVCADSTVTEAVSGCHRLRIN